LIELPKPIDVAALTDTRFGRWSDVQTSHPKNAADPIHYALAMWNIHQGDAVGARAELTDALDDKSPTSYLLYALRGAADIMQHNASDADTNFRKAAVMEKRMYFGEYIPMFPTGEILGGAYFRAGDYASAETAYRSTLGRYPNDARALYGLSQALAKEGNATEAATVAMQFATVWQGSDTVLTPADL
jgi:Tfp pilus assembly protein PilF